MLVVADAHRMIAKQRQFWKLDSMWHKKMRDFLGNNRTTSTEETETLLFSLQKSL
jgi:hypothetical protein